MWSMNDDQNWLLDVLVGHGLACRKARKLVGEAVAWYLAQHYG